MIHIEDAGVGLEDGAPFESLLVEPRPADAAGTPPVLAGVLSSSLGLLCVMEMLSGLVLAGWLLGWGGGVLSPSYENGSSGPGLTAAPMAFARVVAEDAAALGDLSMRGLEAPYTPPQTSSDPVRDGLAGGAPPRVDGRSIEGALGLGLEDRDSRGDSQWLVKWR